MNNFQNLLGEGLSKLQGGIENGKQKLQTVQEINALNKSANDLVKTKSKILSELGQLAYFKIRAGQISDSEMLELIQNLAQIDQKIYTSLKQLTELKALKQQNNTCGNCGNITDSTDKYCGTCGSKMDIQDEVHNSVDRVCNNCGEFIPLNAKYCPCCGIKVLELKSPFKEV
ncbi:hypothetical protein AWM70_04800 [Paenibacillus yonginensis]|uniref:DZANK-type domain-containing protein n=1 Tax=Paenibacillus yonginensis TaxID=1462996 RepID=A0A1B1MXR0_9BACL|nr:hypothetical protein AWM70_04800 [Paenibacillus yonginensis]